MVLDMGVPSLAMTGFSSMQRGAASFQREGDRKFNDKLTHTLFKTIFIDHPKVLKIKE
jgi:hypothetical protein